MRFRLWTPILVFTLVRNVVTSSQASLIRIDAQYRAMLVNMDVAINKSGDHQAIRGVKKVSALLH